MFKRQRRNKKFAWAVGTGVAAAMTGVVLYKLPTLDYVNQQVRNWSFFLTTPPQTQLKLTSVNPSTSSIPALIQRSPQERQSQLIALINQQGGLDQHRSRYLLAVDLIKQNQGEKAIAYLEGLERDYPLLAPYVVYQRARAYTQAGNLDQAETAWKDLLSRYSNQPVVTEALFTLGKTTPKYWDEAIAKFPAHPRSVEIAMIRLRQDPQNLPLLLLVAKHGIYRPEITTILNRLAERDQDELTPEDWETVAFAYWEKQLYPQAGSAYAKATPTPLNAYRAGRGLHLGEKTENARIAYRDLVKNFPDAPETGQGLIHLARLSQTRYAREYLDRAIAKFPDKAGEALLEKAILLDDVQNYKASLQTRELILSQHSQSEAAAKLRWSLAQKRVRTGNLTEAWRWARELTLNNPDSDLAPEAAFWVGKWAQQLGYSADAKSAFEYVLSRYPESYYAWRSAVLLGWNVGDFTTVRQLNPPVKQAMIRPLLPAGSETLKELHQLGQDEDAWKLWQVEFKDPKQPTVAEQFTDGLLRQGVGDYLDGIYMVGSLRQREKSEERSQYQILRQQPAYWQSLYPFPYLGDITNWSKQRQLNPYLVTALIRQESRFMPSIQSPVGAMGLMQVMPDTGSWIAKQINLKSYKLNHPTDNIKLGTWYLDFTHAQYNNNSLLAVASYNAGPGNVSDWINRFGFKDPDEFIKRIPFAETQGYVKSVFENYWNYMRLYDPEIQQQLTQLPNPKLAAPAPAK